MERGGRTNDRKIIQFPVRDLPAQSSVCDVTKTSGKFSLPSEPLDKTSTSETHLDNKITRAKKNSRALALLEKASQIGWRFLLKSKLTRQNPMGKSFVPGYESPFSRSELPFLGQGIDRTLKEVETSVIPGLVKTQSPRFMGHMTSDVPFSVHLADLLASFFNQNLVKAETSGSAASIERTTVGWFHELVYRRTRSYYERIARNPDSCLGTVTNGGTLGNLTALAVARNKLLPEVRSLGLHAAMKARGIERVVVLCSRRSHYSLRKACSLLGLGESNLLEIPVCKMSNRLDIKKLKSVFKELEQKGAKVCAVVGNAGSTETGSVDDLNGLADFCTQHEIWFHVDAAWGGGYLFSQKYGNLLSGIERADSTTLDGHKLIGLTMGHGLVLFRNEYDLSNIKESANYIIRPGSYDAGRFSVEGSRPFSAFKMWFLLRSKGLKHLGERIDQGHENAQRFAQIIRNHPEFELTSKVETNIVTYRYFPALARKILFNQPEMHSQVNEILNELNERIHELGTSRGPGFVSRTKLESLDQHPGVITVLRAIPINKLSTVDHFMDLIQWQEKIGADLLRRLEQKFTALSCR